MSNTDAQLPPGLSLLRRTQVFDAATMPPGLRHRHGTKARVWGVIRVVEGRLRYRILEPASEQILDPAHPGIVRPAQPHEVEPEGPVRFFIEFFGEAVTPATTAG